jgi:hypothetical protein
MQEYQEILKVKELAEGQLRSLPGVHAVGIGKKVIGGISLDEIVITVFVTQKKPLAALKADQVVPAEIDGIRTDVVEMPLPRLHFAANPNNLTFTISPDQQSISFFGKNTPGEGLVVTVQFTATTNAATTKFAVTYETEEHETREVIAKKIARAFNQSTSFTHTTATSTMTSVLVQGKPGTTVLLTGCKIVARDDEKYFKDWMRGGIQIQPGGADELLTSGTIGCLATTQPTPQFPQGMVVGITCHHIVAPVGRKSTNLTLTREGTVVTFAVDSDLIPPGTIVRINFPDIGIHPSMTAYYETIQNDTLANIAGKISKAVNDLPLGPDVNAQPGATTVTISGSDFTGVVFPPTAEDSDSNLKATVAGQTINFSGKVSDDGYGIFVELHPGGLSASFSIFYKPAKKAALEVITRDLAEAITKFKPDRTRGNVTASQSGDTQLIINNVQVVECKISRDIRVGQPDNSFCSICSPCCSHRVGVILDARLDVDVALIQLDAGLKYKPEVQELGLINGTNAPAVDMPVKKRGRSTRQTPGKVANVAVTGVSSDDLRQFTNAFVIQSQTDLPFSSAGDSGAAVVDADNKVIGILFAGANLSSLATPWPSIVEAFPLALNPNPPPPAGQSRDTIRIVPKSAAQLAAPQAKNLADVTAEDIHPTPEGRLGKRVEEAEREITATPAGRKYAALVRHHFSETRQLITDNRRVGVAWQRNGGPQIVEAVMRMLQRRDQPLPDVIDGRPLSDCLTAIQDALAQYASPELAADLATFIPRLQVFAGYSYNQLLAALRTSENGE